MPFYLLPVGRVLPARALGKQAGYDARDDLGRVHRAARPDAGRRHHAARLGQRRQLAADGLVRHAQHADQRLRLPRFVDGRPGELDRRSASSRCSPPGRRSSPTTSPMPMAARGRTPRPASPAGDTGMMLLGSFIVSNFDPESQQDIIDDFDFFAFPAINDEHGQDAVEAPIDGYMMAASPANEEGAKAVLTGYGSGRRRSRPTSPSTSLCSPPTRRPTPAATRRCSRRPPSVVGSATYISQFLDRDTDPDFAANVVGRPSPTSSPTRARSTRSSAPSRNRSHVHLRVSE